MYSIWGGYFIWFQFSASVQVQERRPIKWFCQTTILTRLGFSALTEDTLSHWLLIAEPTSISKARGPTLPLLFLFNCLMFLSASRLIILKWLHSCAELQLIKISFHLMFSRRKDQLSGGFIMRHKVILWTRLSSITGRHFVSLVTSKGIRKWQAAQLRLCKSTPFNIPSSTEKSFLCSVIGGQSGIDRLKIFLSLLKKTNKQTNPPKKTITQFSNCLSADIIQCASQHRLSSTPGHRGLEPVPVVTGHTYSKNFDTFTP